MNMFPDSNIHPILFEECYVKDSSDNNNQRKNEVLEDFPLLQPLACDDYEGVHLFILVHGF